MAASLRRGWSWLEDFSAKPQNLLLVNIITGIVLGGLIVAFLFFSIQTHEALCSIRADHEKRVEATERFLANNPNLKSFRFGTAVITRAELLAQVAEQRSTLRSLDDLNC